MHIFDALLSSILVLVIIAALGLLARQHGVLKKEMAAGLARIVFDFGIPALIFVSLANIDLEPRRFAGTIIMIVVELCMIALAWVVGKRLDLTRSQLGAVVLCSAFGTSATLGYSIVSIVFLFF
ncbi:MAG: AEC family transporter [Saprospiraceae bacterium]|nr:AEC family transporter [Saprospiraceae bacterium]